MTSNEEQKAFEEWWRSDYGKEGMVYNQAEKRCFIAGYQAARQADEALLRECEEMLGNHNSWPNHYLPGSKELETKLKERLGDG